MSYITGLLNPGKIHGLVILSGRVLEELKPFIHLNEELKQLTIFIAHGTADNILPINYADTSYEYLKKRELH